MFTHILPRGETPLGTGVDADLLLLLLLLLLFKVRENVTYKAIEVDSEEKIKKNLNMWLVTLS